jgi:hypothetical protein
MSSILRVPTILANLKRGLNAYGKREREIALPTSPVACTVFPKEDGTFEFSQPHPSHPGAYSLGRGGLHDSKRARLDPSVYLKFKLAKKEEEVRNYYQDCPLPAFPLQKIVMTEADRLEYWRQVAASGNHHRGLDYSITFPYVPVPPVPPLVHDEHETTVSDGVDEDDVIGIPSVNEPAVNSPEAHCMPDSSFTPPPTQPPSPSSDGYEASSFLTSRFSWYTWRDGPLPSYTLLPDSHYAVLVDKCPPVDIFIDDEIEDDVSILSGSDGNDETEDQVPIPPSPPTSPDEDDVTPLVAEATSFEMVDSNLTPAITQVDESVLEYSTDEDDFDNNDVYDDSKEVKNWWYLSSPSSSEASEASSEASQFSWITASDDEVVESVPASAAQADFVFIVGGSDEYNLPTPPTSPVPPTPPSPPSPPTPSTPPPVPPVPPSPPTSPTPPPVVDSHPPPLRRSRRIAMMMPPVLRRSPRLALLPRVSYVGMF